EITRYAGARAGHVQVMVTETNSVSYDPGKQSVSLVNGLFLADDYMTWLANGVSNVDVWALHDGVSMGQDPSWQLQRLYGITTYGDYGVLSTSSSAPGITESAAETPFPAYFALQMLTHLGRPGDQLIAASSNQTLV